MTKVKLTNTAQNIVNQIISADAIEITYGPIVGQRLYTANNIEIKINDEGMIINSSKNDYTGVPLITNDNLNNAKIVNGNIEIPLNRGFSWTAIISLYKLNKVVAIN